MTDIQSSLSVTATEGFDTVVAAELVAAWKSAVPTGDVEVYERKTFDVLPQYIQFVGSHPLWAILAPAAAAFLGRVGYLFADDVMSVARAKLKSSPNEIEQLAAAMHAAMKKLSSPGKALIAINLPDDRWGTALELDATDKAVLAKQLSIFVSNIERIAQLLNEYSSRGEGPLGQGKIEINGDGQIEVSWTSQRDFNRVHLVLEAKS